MGARKGINFSRRSTSFSSKMKGIKFSTAKSEPFFCQRTKKGSSKNIIFRKPFINGWYL